jgi:hypothetical protein
MSFVYWAYDTTCENAVNSGYIGVSENPKQRFNSLRCARVIPPQAKSNILFEGTRKECLKLEKQLRPHTGIGWNKYTGGGATKPSIVSTKVRRLLDNGFGVSHIADMLNISRASVYRYVDPLTQR